MHESGVYLRTSASSFRKDASGVPPGEYSFFVGVWSSGPKLVALMLSVHSARGGDSQLLLAEEVPIPMTMYKERVVESVAHEREPLTALHMQEQADTLSSSPPVQRGVNGNNDA